MAVQIGARPDSGFDDPIGMLKDCHRRIEMFMNILCRIVQQAQGRSLDAEERQAVSAALHYFRESGPRHTMDEEESLFPRLRDMDAATVLDEVQRLESDHQQASALHDEVEQLYSKWTYEGGLNSDEGPRLHTITGKLLKLYREHIRIEEDVVFPYAAEQFDKNALAAMGAEIKVRREL